MPHPMHPPFRRGVDPLSLAPAWRADSTQGAPSRDPGKEKPVMDVISWIITLVVIAVIAGALGFGGVASAASGGASILFWALIVFVLAALVVGIARRN
jgi:uncharacterized membrane protein YtjA (UPF0391 family)